MSALKTLASNFVPVSDFSHGKAAGIFRNLRDDAPVYVLKNNRPIATIITPSQYSEFARLSEDVELLEMALFRLSQADAAGTSMMSEVMAELGITQADLDAIDDSEIELD